MFTVKAITLPLPSLSQTFAFSYATLYHANSASQQTKLTVLAQL